MHSVKKKKKTHKHKQQKIIRWKRTTTPNK